MENHSEWSEATVRWSDHACACTLAFINGEPTETATRRNGVATCGASNQGHGSLCTCLVSLSISCMQTWKFSRAIRPNKKKGMDFWSASVSWRILTSTKNWPCACHNLPCHKTLTCVNLLCLGIHTSAAAPKPTMGGVARVPLRMPRSCSHASISKLHLHQTASTSADPLKGIWGSWPPPSITGRRRTSDEWYCKMKTTPGQPGQVCIE